MSHDTVSNIQHRHDAQPILLAPEVLVRYPISELERANRLLADYQHGVGAIREFFSGQFAPLTSTARTASCDRPRLAATMVAWQEHLGADAAAISAAQFLADPATPVITVGQQSGLLTGPLYTLFKALTAINLARRMAGELGRPVVPVFWLATDDDDRGEADHCACWDAQLALHLLQYPARAGQAGDLIGDLPVGPYGDAVLEQLAPLLTGQPYADEVLALLRVTLAESADMGEWSARLLSRLLSPYGLVLCDPRLPEIRRLSAEVIRRELNRPLATTEQVNARAEELHRLGYRPQLTKPSDACNCYLLDGQRQRISYRDDHFVINGKVFSAATLLALLADAPERFAPNAVLRPVVQEYLFSSSAFVAGPNELGYWAELSPVFATMAMSMPPVVVRAGATVVPGGMAHVLRQLALDPLDLLYNFDQIRLAVLEKTMPESVIQSFSAERENIARLVAHMAEAIAEVDPTLTQSVPAMQQRLLNELDRLKRKTVKAMERKSADQVQRLEMLRDALFPRRGLQERSLNLCCLLARHGFAMLDQLLLLLNEQEGQNLFVEL